MLDLFISTSTFGKNDTSPLKKLDDANISYKLNPFSRKLTPEETLKFAKDAKSIIAGVEDLRILVENSNKLKLISRLGVGLENIPSDLCIKKGIKVTFTPDSVTPAISELTLALILATCRNISKMDKYIKLKKWKRETGYQIKDNVIGIIGFGRVGKRVVELLGAFKPKMILIHDVFIDKDEFEKFKERGLNIESVTFHDLIKIADVISIHLPLNNETKNLISMPEFIMMKKTCSIINTSRGGIVNELDLYKAIKKKEIRSAGLDVFEIEPYSGLLCDMDNIILSPHQGSATVDCRLKMELEVVNDVIRFFNNQPLKQEVIFNE